MSPQPLPQLESNASHKKPANTKPKDNIRLVIAPSPVFYAA